MIVELNDITKTYQKGNRFFHIFQNFNLTVERKELLILSGKSGSGKSTLLALMGGYLKPDAGQVRYNGESILDIGDRTLSNIHANKIGYLPQSNIMVSEFTIMENIVLKSLIIGEKERESKALELMELLSISSLANQFPHELSGGELRRVAIARMLLNEAELYLIDEPTSGLDQDMVRSIMQYLQKCVHRGSTMVIATHDNMVKEYGSRIIEIDRNYNLG